MAGYARDWQIFPFVAYISLAATGFGQPRATAANKKKAEKEAMDESVILLLANLYGKTAP
jgi:hypothetical protein